MRIEIFEKAAFSSENSDLDMLLDYSIQQLEDRGITVKRYDKLLDPEYFEGLEGYALPVVKLNGEILCAGAYDFTLIDRKLLSGNSCGQCCSKGGGGGCASCPGKQHCQKV